MALREAEQRLGVADRLAACLVDLRAPDQITHSLSGIIRFRLLMIAAGYEDGNDASRLRDNPLFKMAMNDAVRSPALLPVDDLAAGKPARRARAFAHGPRHGRSLLRLPPGSSTRGFPRGSRSTSTTPSMRSMAASSCACSTPITTTTGFSRWSYSTRRAALSRPMLRPARRPSGREARAFLRRLVCAIRANWPRTEILVRADSHYCSPEVLDWCRANGVDYVLGGAPNATLRRHTETLEAGVKARFEAAPRDGKVRRFKEFFDAAASWSRVERVIARVEAGEDGPDTRFIVTNLARRNARSLYEDVYCPRGHAQNHIKSFKTHLAADRTSCTKASANQLRLFLHAGAYWLMWGLRESMPKRSMWRVAQFDTLRLRFVKIAARVVEMKTMIRVHLQTACPGQELLRFALSQMPRLGSPVVSQLVV